MSPGREALIEARGLSRSYRRGGGRFRTGDRIEAFQEIDLVLETGRVVGLVGASGAGKSSLARCLARLERADSGRLLYRGVDLDDAPAAVRARWRSDVQLVFQNAERAFHPHWTALAVLEEPLRLAGETADVRRERTAELVVQVGLDPALLDRRARDLSGGQMKRLNLARALASEPRALILDEPFSGLDVSLQAQLANLLSELQSRHGFACLHISHDLTMVGLLADDVLVMDRGRIVERGPAPLVLRRPEHPASRALVAAGTLASVAAGG